MRMYEVRIRYQGSVTTVKCTPATIAMRRHWSRSSSATRSWCLRQDQSNRDPFGAGCPMEGATRINL